MSSWRVKIGRGGDHLGQLSDVFLYANRRFAKEQKALRSGLLSYKFSVFLGSGLVVVLPWSFSVGRL